MNPEDLLSPATPPPCEEEAESVSSLRLLESSPALSEASVESSESKTRGMLLLATRSYSSSEGEDPEDMEDRSALSADSTAPSESKDDQVSEDYEEKGASSSVQGSCSSIQGDSYDGLSPSPPNERASYKRPAQYGDAIDDMEMSVESLMVLAQQRGLATTALSQWSVREDGKLLDPDLRKYRSLRDALRAYTHLCQGAIPREDIYYLAILRRVLAEQDLPLVDGPISVVALGTVVPEDHFYTSKKLFPIGYETLVNVQVTTPTTVAFRLRCKIVHGNKKKSPIFVVELEHSAEIVFRSYVASKAWKKALVHFESLPADELMSVVSESVINIESDSSNTTDVLTPSSGEDGFGLLRRNVTRVLEGLHQVLLCKDYQFWEQRHPITPDVHAKIRSRLKDQAKDILKAQNALSKEEIKWQLSQEVLLEEHAHNPEELYRMRQQKEKDRREADKRSVREAARKLLEIEMKAQEDAKEAQRRAKEERKNALLEAKMEAVRQKEARKEALRLVREEEKRVREEEKEVKRALREEEKRKKLEEKENSMKRRIEELRQRRQMREEQKAILENGVVTSFSPRRFNDSRKRKASGGVPDAQTIRQQHLALLKFVEEEKERRRQIRVWEKKNEVEQFIWTRVKTQYMQGLDNDRYLDRKLHSGPDGQDSVATQDSKFPVQATSAAVELAPVPAEAQADLLFVWDFISTFSNCLKLTVLPSLSAFVSMVVVSDGSSPVGDGILDEDSVGSLLASLHADLLKRLLTEYFPVLQLGITIDEFFRTRPMNVFSWPELARLACQLAMEFKHPSGDEHLLKFVKGSKSFRDDSVAQPLRQKLHRRGTNLLKGVKFEEEVDEAEVGPQALVEKVTATQVSEANPSSAASGDYYGVVLANGIQSKFEVGEKDNHLVVTSIVSSSSDKSSTEKTKPTESASPDQKDDNADMVQVGDCLVCINGHDVREMTLGDFKTLVGSLSTPHGLMMSSIVPVVKTQVRHFATTQSSTKMKCCAFVLKLLRSKEIAAPFNQPVDAELYPDYYSSGDIAEPMDLGTISEKIEDEDYENDDVDSFVDDVALVWKNCYTYNSLKAEISNLAQKLAVIFDRLMKEWVYTTDNRPLIAGEEDNCRNCQTIHVKGRLLLCDRCDAPYHTFCLASPLPAIPKGEWFCPTCVADPSFSPEQFRKKARDMTASSSDSSGNNVANEGDFTDLEKRIQCVIDLLSQDNYTKLTVGDRLKVLRVLCELLEETAAVQSIYHSLEEKTSDVRRRLGDPLADLEREWDRFCPPRSSHGVEQTKKFIIDGVEHELTDELLTYLEEKAHAELEAKPVPALPESAQKKLRGEGGAVEPKLADLMCEDENDGDTSDCSEVGEDMIIEELGDRYLLASVGLSSAERGQGGSNEQAVLRSTCAFCGLEDGILNGPLQACKRSPLTADTSLLNKYEIPGLLADDGPDMLIVQRLDANDISSIILEDTPDGVRYSDPLRSGLSGETNVYSQDGAETQQQTEFTKNIVYAINDRVVYGSNRTAVYDYLRGAPQPVLLYLTSLPGDAVRASVSIVKCHGLHLGVNLDSYESFVFVQSYRSSEDLPLGYGQLSGQVFPGDVLLMVNGNSTLGENVADVEALLQLDSPNDVKYAVFVRPPSAKMKKSLEEWQRVIHDVPSQRAKESAFRAGLMSSHVNGPISFDVIFQDGPLGLALALEPRGVVVKSLNDHADGTLGQASMSGRILRGDLVEQVNGASYGKLSDLSQFTSWLLSLPRPLNIKFSRQAPAGGTGPMPPTPMKPSMDKLLSSHSLLMKHLDLPATTNVKTYRVEALPLPFEAENFLEALGVISTSGLVYCETNAETKETGTEIVPLTVEIGDAIVGLNGQPIAGLNWTSVRELCAELLPTTPVYLHFAPFVNSVTSLHAHENCIETANIAWSECGYVLPKVEKARELERFIKWTIIPRTLSLGKCRHDYSFYRFYSDRQRLFVQSPDKKWSVCATREQFTELLAYLEIDPKDGKLATRIRWCFHWPPHNEDVKAQQYLREGPFSFEKEVLLAMSDGDMEKYEAVMAYHGRRFFIGSFHAQQEAENALQRAEASVRSTGLHVAIAADTSTLRSAHFPSSLNAPFLKAENVVKRVLARKYEYGSVMDARGKMKPSPISQEVYDTLRRGLRSSTALAADTSGNGMQSIKMQGDAQSSAAYVMAQAKYQEALKRKYAQADNPYARQMAEQLKRSRYMDPNAPGRMTSQQPFPPGVANAAILFKRSLQALVDQGRAMLAAWNQYAASASVQTTNGLAYACLSSFEEVKKAVSRIVGDPNAPHPDQKTFVCLHHAYVMGLICATATQALTSSRKTRSDSALVKQVADAFATAILSCVDPSSNLRGRALTGFAAAAKKCEPSQRAGDLSPELHNFANFVLLFLRTTRYIAGSNFEDLRNCRPLFSASTPGVESLPQSFVQQINLLENVREAFYRQLSMSAGSISTQVMPPGSLQIPPYGMAPGSMPMGARVNNMQTMNQGTNTGTLVDVDFGYGPLGVVINYSNRGTIVVTEFSNDNGMIGQAQASGKVQVGDEVYAVSGSRLDAIGMEGFKAAVATSKRPLRVTFRRFTLGVNEVGAGAAMGMMSNANVLRQPAQNIASTLGYPVVSAAQGTVIAPSNQLGVLPGTINQQSPPQNTLPVSADNAGGGVYQTPNPEPFSNMNANVSPFPFPSPPSSQPMGGASSAQFGTSQVNGNVNTYMGEVPAQPYPVAPANGPSYETLPNAYQDGSSGGPVAQSSDWQGAPNPMNNFSQGAMQQFPPGPARNEVNMNGDGSAQLPLDPITAMPNGSAPMGYQSGSAPTEYVNFVAGNDPQLPPEGGDPSQVTFYDANGTTFRGGSDFDIDTSGTAPLSSDTSVQPTDTTIADADTEPESPSISQATTPAQSDTDGERTEADRQRDRAAQLANLTAVSSALQSSSQQVSTSSTSNPPSAQVPTAAKTQVLAAATSVDPVAVEPMGKPPLQMPKSSPLGGKGAASTEDQAASRRSSRVSRKIANIGDMYDPDFMKSHSKAGGAGSGSDAGDEPTDGDIGELSTELLEAFRTTIRPLKTTVPRSLLLLRAQLLTMEAAIPRDAFRSGRWGRPVRAGWAEMLYSCDSPRTLMEAIVFLEFNIEAEWLDPCWKASPLQSAKNAVSTATIASAAMRLYALDDAISYGRMKRGGKRNKPRNPSSANSSRPGSPTKTALVSQETSAPTGPISHPSDLPFMKKLSNGVIVLADKMIHRILEGQKERASNTYAYRRAKSELAAVTSLTEDEVEQWIQVSSTVASTSQSGRGGLSVSTSSQGGAAGRHGTPKRKHPGSQAAGSAGQRPSSSRKRRAQGSANTAAPPPPEAQFVELRCYQLKTPQLFFPAGSAQDMTLRMRLEYIVDLLLRNELALAFSAPVNAEDVPGYADLIKHPMDLGTVKMRLSRGFYDQRFELVVRDVNLIWDNCFTFNRLDADISQCANRLRSIFNRMFEQWIMNVPPNTPLTHLASEELCRQCGQMNAQDSMLLCDSCDAAYHLFCLQPPLAAIPPGNWYCPRCPLQKFSI